MVLFTKLDKIRVVQIQEKEKVPYGLVEFDTFVRCASGGGLDNEEESLDRSKDVDVAST